MRFTLYCCYCLLTSPNLVCRMQAEVIHRPLSRPFHTTVVQDIAIAGFVVAQLLL